MGVRPQVVGRAGSATRERDCVEAAWNRQGGTENAGHELVSRVRVYGCAAGVSVVVPPAVLCGRVNTRDISEQVVSAVGDNNP